MSNCLFCNVELTSTNSAQEHIIPNAIGGRLKSSNLDCIKCNSEFGEDCDSALAKDMNPLANILGIDRERGEPQPIVGLMQGKKVSLDTDGKPEFGKPEHEVKKDGNNVQISIKARSMGEARKMLEGLARKYPINVDEAMKSAQVKQEYLPEPIAFNFAHGGEDTFRAVAKMAYLFLKHKRPGQSLDREVALIDSIKGTRENTSVSFLAGDRIVDPAPGQVLHSIVIKSYPAERLLVAYVELFSVFTFVVLLSEDCGEDVFEDYVFDPVERQELASARFRLPNLDRKTLTAMLDMLPSPAASIEMRVADFFKIANDRRQKAAFDAIIEKAMARTLKRYPEGTIITKEMIAEMSAAIAEEVAPLMRRQRDQGPS
jgi:hypothetical protein